MMAAKPPRRGFSLIELLFAMAIGSIILFLAASMLGSSADGYGRVGGSVSTEREARAVMTQLAADLSTALFQKDQVVEEKSNGAWPASRLGFLTLQPAEAQTDAGRAGDLCAVNYRLDDLKIGGKTVRCLLRGFRESKDTFAALRKSGGVGELFAEKPAADEPIAFGVVSFQALPKSRDAAGKWADWTKNDKSGPDALEIRLVLARRDFAKRLKTPADWDGVATDADKTSDLATYRATLRFGNHDAP